MRILLKLNGLGKEVVRFSMWTFIGAHWFYYACVIYGLCSTEFKDSKECVTQ